MYHIFCAVGTTKYTKKKDSEEEVNSSAFPLKMFWQDFVFFGIFPTLDETSFCILGLLMLSLARVTIWPCLPQTVLAYICGLCKVTNSIPIHSQMHPSVEDKFHGHPH